MNDRATILLHRRETGFRTDAGRLKELGQDFLAILESARRMVPPHATNQSQARWNRLWDEGEHLLPCISAQLIEIQDCIERDDQEKLVHALETWPTIQPKEAELYQAQALGLGADTQRDWNTLSGLIRTHLETLKATTQSLRVKLQLLQQYPKEEMDGIVHGVLARLPSASRKSSASRGASWIRSGPCSYGWRAPGNACAKITIPRRCAAEISRWQKKHRSRRPVTYLPDRQESGGQPKFLL